MKKGFVLLETIVIISVLCITLTMLYTGYSNVIRSVKTNFRHDSTEYLYKTAIIGNFMEEDIDEAWIKGENYYVYPFYLKNDINKNTFNTDENYIESRIENESKYNNIFNEMKVQAVYITVWNTKKKLVDSNTRNNFPPTVLTYINSINAKSKEDSFRLIIMYDDENNSNKKQYQVASIEFKPKINSLNT